MSEVDFDQDDHYPAEGQWDADQVPPGTEPENGPVGPTLPDEPANVDDTIPEGPIVDTRPPLTLDQQLINFIQTRKDSSAVEGADEAVLAFIRENPNSLMKILNHYNELIESISTGNTVASIKDATWMETLIGGMANLQLGDVPVRATERTGSEWRQGVLPVGGEQGQELRSGRPSQKLNKDRRASKEEMLAYLARKSGNGGFYDTFLPHSGIWLRLRAPTLAEIVSLLTEMASVKLRLGAESKGMAFSNASAIMLDAITTLALSCVVSSNHKYVSPSDLEAVLSIYDEVLLHHGLAAAMYPDGFQYAVPCVANPNTCSHVERFKLNMSSIVWFDNLVFTQEQRKHLAKRFQPSTDEEFEAYRKDFTVTQKKVFWFGDIGLRLAVPTIEKRRASGGQWMQALIDMTQGAFNEQPHGQQRQRYIDNLAQATTALQYAHWVDGIYEREDEYEDFEDQFVTDDPEVIVPYLRDNLATSAEVADSFFKAVHEYVNSSVIGIVALPSYDCPACKGEQGKTHSERFPHLVPIDMVGVFFTLARQKVSHLDL
ncbi:hypothetical protein AVT69_gp073 [Pseudomonas phage PhiPA3]|uniref:Uncharacterized protein 074 n=1 Tax=Pseudomonas phage PhiPA3 TaxID=998086 RepID=F8SJV3_BPPA3|nr:hypothetical protein AVT69_gp073 [Pseudomonas phage PhiPA3]AEH03498.1 hypothetical protein [Pseudomonas phage PhiPA3]